MSPFKPPYDPELLPILNAFPALPVFDKENLGVIRVGLDTMATVEATMIDPAITHREITIPGPGGKIALSILESKSTKGGARPGIFYMHGGGMILGSKLLSIGGTFDWIKELDAVLVSVEYRLAPEHPYPAAIEDCYTGLKWVSDHVSELGIDGDKIIVAGNSAGGGLAAGLSLLARDRKGPKIFAQCLIYPMLDDRMQDASSKQYMNEGTWTGVNNVIAWDWYAPGKRGKSDMSIYAAPARATDLSGLPQAWVDVGGAELFRDQDTAYATKMAEFGVSVELHVWPGSWHTSDVAAPQSALSTVTNATRVEWFKRILAQASTVPKKIVALL